MIGSSQLLLEEYAISTEHGFLPEGLPLSKLPESYYAPWEDLASELPSLISSGNIRHLVDRLPVLSTSWLHTEPEWRRAYVVLGFLTHAYIWGGEKPKDILPPPISMPLLEISSHLELPPCATYAGLTLWNFVPTHEGADLTNPDNLRLQTSFTGTKDEEWFIVISVAIEAKGAQVVPLMLDAIAAANANDADRLAALLCRFTDVLRDLNSTLKRMHEKCAPAVFFYQLRPFLAGSKNMKTAGLPSGVFYNLGHGHGKWHQYSGGSNAQSSLIQTFDIFLGVNHSSTGDIRPSGTSYIQEMRKYMPAPHRRFLEHLSTVSSIRNFVKSSCAESPIKEAYNAAVLTLSAFRDTHIQIVSRYIITPARSSAAAPCPVEKNGSDTTTAGAGAGDHHRVVNLATASTKVKGLAGDETNATGLYGTGGTTLIPFLKQTRDTTKAATC